MKKNIRIKAIDDTNPALLTLQDVNELDTIIKVELYAKESHDYEVGDEGTIVSKYNGHKNQVYYSDLHLNGELVLITSDTLNIYRHGLKQLPLKSPGQFAININKVEWKPIKNNMVGTQSFKEHYIGFKFTYSFVDNFAKDSSFYLAIDLQKNIDSEKLNKHLTYLREIIEMSGLKNYDFEQILNKDDDICARLANDLNDKLKIKPVRSKITSFYAKDGQLIVTYLGNEVKEFLKIDFDLHKQSLQSTRARRLSDVNRVQDPTKAMYAQAGIDTGVVVKERSSDAGLGIADDINQRLDDIERGASSGGHFDITKLMDQSQDLPEMEEEMEWGDENDYVERVEEDDSDEAF